MTSRSRADEIDTTLAWIWTKLGLMNATCTCGAPIPDQAIVQLCDTCLMDKLRSSIRKSIEDESAIGASLWSSTS